MSTTRKAAPGRPAHAPTVKERSQVKGLTAMGLTQEEIASVMQLSEPTLRKHYWVEMQTGRVEAKVKVAQSLFRMATNPDKPNVVAAIFWLKAQGGWRDSDAEQGGKKAQTESEARTAHQGTQWDSLLRVQ